MELIRPNTTIDFIRYRNVATLGSLAVILVGAAVLFMRGQPNWGIDFSGGALVHVRFDRAVGTGEVRAALGDLALGADAVQDAGGGAEFLIRLPLKGEATEDPTRAVSEALAAKFGKEHVDILRVERVGPRIGEALRQKAIWAVTFATVMMGVYIWIRFEWRFGVGAAVALAHDVLVTLAALVVWNYELDLTIVAALLTIVGFSVNDTVVVSDRIRENMRKDRRSTLADIINRSINETLGRTFLTSGTAITVVVALFALGGSVIHGFAFSLLIGFIAGVYSTIYIASPVVLFFERSVRPRR
jgi:preprotein translocase subunit SecF